MLVPVWTLRRENDLGIGDLAALRELIVWAGKQNLGFLQLLPINETAGDHSPYNAISSVALEPSLLDLTQVPGLSEEDIVSAQQKLPRHIFTNDSVDYLPVKKLKRELLELAFKRFWEHREKNEQTETFQQFREFESSWLDDYCLFRFLMDQEGGKECWDFWSINYNTAEKARSYLSKPGEETEERLAFYAWVQWVAFTQWKNLRKFADEHDVKLMGDIPIGVSYYSADVFFEPQWFDLQWFGGAPPETVFKDDAFACKWGQNWGVPLYRWDVLEQNDFSWWRRRIDKLTDVFHIFRIDHILGFYRIYSFPWHPRRNAAFLPLSHEEAAARTGGKLPGFKPFPDDTEEHCDSNLADGDKYLRVILQATGENEIVGEDLGTVPDYVRPHLLKLGIAGFKICHWEAELDEKTDTEHPIPGEDYEECSFATYSTHDHPSIAGLWEEFRTNLDSSEEDERTGAEWNLRILSEIAGLTVPKDPSNYEKYSVKTQWALLQALFACHSRYAAFMITDLYRRADRFNIPGTVGTHNWSARMPFTVADMSRDPKLSQEAKKLKTLIKQTKRV